MISDPAASMAALFGLRSVMVIAPMTGCSCAVSILAVNVVVFVPIVVLPFFVTHVIVPSIV